jgi:hypothetical protein
MSAPQYPLIQGKRYDWSSIDIALGKVSGGAPVPRLRGYKGLDWSQKLDGKPSRGNAAVPLGHTRGQYSATASMTLHKVEWDYMRLQLGSGYGELDLNITATWIESGLEHKCELVVRIGEEKESGKEGGDEPEVSLSLIVLQPIKLDGLTLVKDAFR